jgi:hypothetical protein
MIPLELDPDEFPNIAAVGSHLHAFDRDAAFAFGLDALSIEALSSHAPTCAASARPAVALGGSRADVRRAVGLLDR